MRRPLLDIEGLSARTADGQAVLLDVSLLMGPGEVHGLVGQSGAGKTSIAKAVLGILPRAITLNEGSIRFDGTELIGAPAATLDKLLGTDIALIPQDPMTALNPSRRIGAQLTDSLRLKAGLSKSAAMERARKLLEEVHLTDTRRILRAYPHELSGGMRQRVLIASAFALNPRLIIADEPTSALDVTVQKQILRLIRRLQREHETAVLFVTHDLGVVAQICDDVTVLFSGAVVEQTTVHHLFRHPRHVYTRALIASNPRYDQPGASLRPISDEVIADTLQSLDAKGAS
ncbi:MAG: ABC transporter ATP-binding protein [Alphaproteobacteria bacterium]|nr:ABC transporter ATP-binding protein [Alphaproteobacteria bacterium]